MMKSAQSDHSLSSAFLRDYGMVFVLLFLALLFSALTFKQQSPTGADAGREVARLILRQAADSPHVVIVGRDTVEDRQFTSAARQTLTAGGAQVRAVVNGGPADLRKALEQILADQQQVDAIAANNVTAKWTVYDSFPEVGQKKCVTPGTYYWPDFIKVSNLTGVANQTAIYAIIAIGMTMVVITGGIDLSVGSLVALASVCTAIFIRDVGGGKEASMVMMLLGCGVGVAVCALAGAFNGAMVTRFNVPAFIVTLSMMMMASGLAFRISGGESSDKLPPMFRTMANGDLLGIPNPVILMGALYLIAQVVMSKTIFGRYVYAIGGNVAAARLSGVPVKRTLLLVYIICGALAGLGGVIQSSKLNAGDPKYGLMLELDVIAAVVVGGTSLMGGQGRIFGTLIGAFIIAVIRNGMNLTNVDPFNQKIVLGAVLLAAVLIDTLKRRNSR